MYVLETNAFKLDSALKIFVTPLTISKRWQILLFLRFHDHLEDFQTISKPHYLNPMSKISYQTRRDCREETQRAYYLDSYFWLNWAFWETRPVMKKNWL